MSEVRIIGIGSPFGDDRIGWEAVDAIDESGMLGRFPPGMVGAYRCSQPAVGLLPLLAGANAAILIDAIRGGAAPGTWRRIDAGDLQPDPGNISSHGLGVPESLALGRSLGLLPETIVFYGIEIRHAGPWPGIRAEVRAAIPGLLREIAAELQSLICNGQVSMNRSASDCPP